MAIVTIPTESGICKVLAQMSDKDVVLATSEDDFRDWSACELGAKIAEKPAMVGDGYDYLVLNPGTDCIERYPKPPPPVYNSELLDPWTGVKDFEGIFPNTIGMDAAHILNLPVFSGDVNLFVAYTLGTDSNGIEWTPGGPIQTPGATYGTSYEGYETLPVIKESSGIGIRSYYRKVFVKAGQAGLTLAIGLWGGGGGGWGHYGGVLGLSQITAIAFKA
jgi:hypothetical protein